MTSFRLFGAALVLSAIAVVPVSAQEAIQEPAAFAFYYPNADVLNSPFGGRTASNSMAQSLRSGNVASTQMSARAPRTLRVTPAKRN